MPNLDPDAQFESIKSSIAEALKKQFKVQGRTSSIEIEDVDFKDEKSSQDVADQKEAILEGKSWTIPVYGTVVLKKGGEEVDRKRMLLMRLPKMTDRFGFIVEGKERQVLNQFRLKSGVYHRVAPSGDVLSEFNLQNPDQFANGKSFKLRLDPQSAVFYLDHRNSNIPLYHVLKAMGADDGELRHAWGDEIFEKNQSKYSADKTFNALKRAVGEGPKDGQDSSGWIQSLFSKTKLLPDTTEKTLGKAYKTVDEDLLVTSTKRLLDISRGKGEEDDKNSLEYQGIYSVEDLLAGHLTRAAGQIRRKISNNLERKKKVRDILTSDAFDGAMKGFFSGSLVNPGDQTNPLEMVSGSLKTTIMGEQGGIQSQHAITESAKLINPSHLGFLDPIHTPEGPRTGITLAIPLGAEKRGNELVAGFYDVKKGKRVEVKAGDALEATVAFPDQYTSGFKPVGRKVKATKKGQVIWVDPKEVDYVIPSPRSAFGIASNLIPFLQNNQGNRAMTAARQQEQAVPLLHREAPLVQVKTDRNDTFEDIIGSFATRKSPVDGEVTQVREDRILVKDGKGKQHQIQLYRDFPLAGNSLYDSEVKVKAGDRVKEGQLVADSTFTKNGKLALGTSLRTAYMPWQGYNYEDGIVVSEEAAKKLTSLHLNKNDIPVNKDTILDKRKYMSQFPHAWKKEQVEKIGDDGFVRVGQEVREGDPLVLSLAPPTESQLRKQINEFRRGRPDKFKDKTLTWDKSSPGVVTDVVKRGDSVVVYVRTEEPAQVGDKLVGRHGNKGVITRVVPQSEMPYTLSKDGKEKKYTDILMNPLGVPGRINLGQVLETVAGKIAVKNGKPYEVKNFEPGKDYLEDIRKDLKAHDLEDKEVMMDPETGKPFKEKVLVGEQYILKLKHQSEKGIAARSGYGGPGVHYDLNRAPVGGSPHGGQSMGELGLYALLAHGARENIWEMYSYKTSMNDALWDAIRDNKPIPPPQIPFAYNKFLNYLNAMRVDVRKEGNSLQLVPFTEKQIETMSSGELKEPGLVVVGKNLKPIAGGLFDERTTGGLQGTKWAHFMLAEPLPNPLFENAIKKLTGLNEKRFMDIVEGKVEIGGKTGGPAIEAMLKGIDVKKRREVVEKKIKEARGAGLDKLHQELRILRALDENNLDPTVYMMRSVPVLPPIFRPLSAKEDGSISTGDINYLYKDIGALNEVMRGNKSLQLPDSQMRNLRGSMYDGVKALYGMGGSLTRQGEYQGILDMVSGKIRSKGGQSEGASKRGYFQRQIMKRRQDFSARAVITVEPRMGLDEVGLPEFIAWNIYQPFIERNLTLQGYKPLDAQAAVEKHELAAEKALQRVMGEIPVLIKRDPALHKFNVMAFKPHLVKGKSMEVHPLVTGGFNADFDGDKMSVYLPITSGAVKEAQKLYPSNNLFSPTTGAVMYTPGHEALLGTYLLSLTGKKTKYEFATQEAAESAKRQGKILDTDVVKIGSHWTTLGRTKIESGLPKWAVQTGKVSPDKFTPLDKKEMKRLLLQVAKRAPDEYGNVANHLKDLGNEYSTKQGFSIGLSDFAVVNKDERNKLIAQAERKADAVKRDKSLKQDAKDQKVVRIYEQASDKLDEINDKELKKNPTNISRMVSSGSRGDPQQLKQIISTPALVKDAKNDTVPYFIPKSYSEGMDLASYWTTMHGARKGTIQKTQEVKDPGYLSKRMVNSTMAELVTEEDCHTKDGITMSTHDPDVSDRYLSGTIRLGKHRYRAGALVTPELLSEAARYKVQTLPVRSPMRCHAEHGVCKHCLGLTESGKTYDIGTNIGVIAAQAVGEPSTQLSLSAFHTGGIAKSRGSQAGTSFDRLQQLLTMPQNLPNEATLASAPGKVSKIEKAPQGGSYVTVGNERYYAPTGLELAVKLHQDVKKGQPLTGGLQDPKKVLALRGIREVQDYLADQMQTVLQTATPVKRRNVEVVVRTMTNVSKVTNRGGQAEWIEGDVRPTSVIQEYNAKHKENPVLFAPILKGVDVLPTEVSEDWVARLNFQNLTRTITQAAREGWRSNIHGFHPVPAAARGVEFGRAEKHLKPGEYKGQY